MTNDALNCHAVCPKCSHDWFHHSPANTQITPEVRERCAREIARREYRANGLETIYPGTEEQYADHVWKEYLPTVDAVLAELNIRVERE